MNSQIVSNTKNVINTNTTNKFEMHLAHSIDALNNKAFIEVTNVCYPSTTKNVLKDTCSIDLEFEFTNFLFTYGDPATINATYRNTAVDIKSTIPGLAENSLLFLTTKRVNILEGIHDLRQLIEYINNAYEAYGVFFR